jgi:non-lysosomal glucosylceramidase
MPKLTHYDSDHLSRIAMPLGGIGTGQVSLGGRGDLRDWELMNRPAKGYKPPIDERVAPFFAIRTQSGKETPRTRALEGPMEDYEVEGATGSPVYNH